MSIKLTDLSHVYLRGTPSAVTALRNITLEIQRGICLGIAGKSGSGKTTLIQHLNGLLQPTSGCISIDNLKSAELRHRVGLVFQSPEQQLFAETVHQEISFGLASGGLSPEEIDERVRAALAEVGLAEDVLELSPFRLSGGEKRRLAIASVLVSRPEVLVLDEPCAGLDPQGRLEILKLLATLRCELKLTLVIVSHNMEDLAHLAERTILLHHGEIIAQGATRDVMQDLAALQMTGLTPPAITSFMLELQRTIPEIQRGILTVSEAHAEIKRVLSLRSAGGRV